MRELQRGLPALRPRAPVHGQPRPDAARRAAAPRLPTARAGRLRHRRGTRRNRRRRPRRARVRGRRSSNGGRRDVVLLEAADELGGALATRRAAPHRTGWRRILDFYAAGLGASKVDVRVGARPRQEISRVRPRSCSRPEAWRRHRSCRASSWQSRRPPCSTRERPAWRALGRIVVVDDGFGWWPGVNAVEVAVLAGAAQITVLTPSGAFATGVPPESRIQLLPAPSRARGSRRSRSSTPTAVGPEGVTARHRFSGEEQLVPADVVVLVGRAGLPPAGRRPTGDRARAADRRRRRPATRGPRDRRGPCGRSDDPGPVMSRRFR